MAVTKLKRLARPTNANLQDQVAEVHECLEQVSRTQGDNKEALGNLDLAQKVTQLQLALFARAMGIRLPTAEEMAQGVPPEKIRRRLGGMDPWKIGAGAVPVVAGGVGLYKIVEPALVAFIAALHHQLLNAH